jgi:hypothetical protein
LQATCSSLNTCDIQAIRIAIYSGSSVSYPSNGTVLAQLVRVTSYASGGTAINAQKHNSTDIAANTTFLDASGSAITNTETAGAILWQQSIPFTAGANWAEWVTPGSEWRVSASGIVAIYLTASSAGTATDFAASLVFIE